MSFILGTVTPPKNKRLSSRQPLLLFNLKSNTMKTQCKYSNYVFITAVPEESSHTLCI